MSYLKVDGTCTRATVSFVAEIKFSYDVSHSGASSEGNVILFVEVTLAGEKIGSAGRCRFLRCKKVTFYNRVTQTPR